eukprot:TRINITY_DN2973_c0_g3_i3.p1 TRINITY_DN2973_c0_g3~~TRINITY_DN2973_c0_g3_i3.p1  ORF type:complete len:334 (-),score=61.14 TRINITY_DN2973_c0_g3_i3:288-1289(-)
MATLTFNVSMMSGDAMDVNVPSDGTVLHLREGVEAIHEVPPACLLKMFQGGDVLEDQRLVSELNAEEQIFAIVVRETKVEILLQAAGSYQGYKDLLASASDDPDEATSKLVGPMPSILSVLEDMRGEPVEVANLVKAEDPERMEFGGSDGVLILPSLDADPLLKKAGKESFTAVTLTVEVNSDAYNRGLGVVLEASPLMEPSKDDKGLPTYIYNGYGISDDKVQNAIKFHPQMSGGQLRNEGAGGWGNSNVGFTPLSWQQSQHKFHKLQLLLKPDGSNTFTIKGTEEGQTWERSWKRVYTNGRYIPALYAWLDLGGNDRPLMIGEISMKLHFD